MNEFEFIAWVRELLSRPGDRDRVPMGIGDDMAVINFRGGKLLLASDMVIENSHFTFDQATPQQIGHKALGRCLSDCAAMAGEPLAAIVSLARPTDLADEVLKGVFEGMNALAERFGCPIVGGDTSSSREGLVIDVSLLGQCERNEPILRSGAKPGDYLYVTGPLGGSILGRHLTFIPRIEEALWLAEHLPVNALIDISDGLSSDLAHLCEESGCGAELFSHALDKAISDDARHLSDKTGQDPLEHALDDGEDFELLLAIPAAPVDLPDFPDNICLLPVGHMTEESVMTVITPTGRQMEIYPGGFRHF